MTTQLSITENLIRWGNNRSEIRSLILTGSRAIKGKSDELSDYDIAVFLNDAFPFTLNDDWLSEISKLWVCVHEKIDWQDDVILTRLVIFELGVKIDFAFYPIKVLKALASSALPDEFAAGYQILVDKDEIAAAMDAPSEGCYRQDPPNQNEFQRIIEEFWFEVYHVAKYLARGDLWSAKFRDAGIKQEFLLQMIRWHAQAKHDWAYTTHTQGKRIQEWVDNETWNELQQCFGHLKEKDSWHALKQIMALFRRLSHETARLLGFSYPLELDDNISYLAKSYEDFEKIQPNNTLYEDL